MATEDVYEQAKIKTNAKLVSGKIIKTSYSGKLDLSYVKNGNTGAPLHADKDIEVKKGVVSREYTLPNVGGDEENYELKVIAKYGKKKEKTAVLGEYTVWPKEVKLTVKDRRSGEVKKHAKFTLTQGKKNTAGATDENGKATQPLDKALYSIKIKAPLELVEDKQPTKRNHEIAVDVQQVAKFLAPDITDDKIKPATEGGNKKTGGVRQYVNMTSASDGADGKGSIIEFEVCNKTQEHGLKDDKIYIKVTFTMESKRNNPKPAIVAGTAQSIAEADGGKTWTGFVKLPSDGGAAKFKVELGLAGGETATVSVGYTKDDPADDKLIFVSWRKLGYQLRFAEMFKPRLTERTRDNGSKYLDIPDSIFNVYKQRLALVFIEYENIKSHEFPNPADDAPCMVPKKFLEGGGDETKVYVLDGGQNWTTGAAAFDAPADKREIHITLCEKAYSSNGAEVNPKHELTQAVTDTRIYVPPPGKPSYVFLKKNHTKVDEINIRVTGLNWTAKMDGVAADDKNIQPAFSMTDATGDHGARTYSISEPTCGGAAIQVTLTEGGMLPATEKTKIKNYYEACFNDAKKLRQAGAKLEFQISGPSTGEGAETNRNRLRMAVNDVHTTSAKRVLFHPGLDDDGNPRTGPMSDVTIDHYNLIKMKVTLPKRDNPTDPPKPGDFAGAASKTTCPVLIEFVVDGTNSINGNAGSGSQLLVLKTDLPGPCASTVCHELGHSMGMTVMAPFGGSAVPTPPGLTAPKHVDNGGWYYRDKSATPYNNGYRNLHKGGHCANGMPGGNKADAKFSGFSPGSADDVCIMWGSGGSDDNRKKYCPDCTEVLKARRLEDIRGRWDGRANG